MMSALGALGLGPTLGLTFYRVALTQVQYEGWKCMPRDAWGPCPHLSSRGGNWSRKNCSYKAPAAESLKADRKRLETAPR